MLRNLKSHATTAHRSLFSRKPSTTAAPARNHRLLFEPLEPRVVLNGNSLVISELMAVNDTVLTDGDGDYRDWLEIYNPTASDVDLDGWYLTDDAADLTKWQFPTVTIESGQCLVVFASDKYPNGPAGELHTNFKLTSEGEYLGLVRPDDVTVEFAYDPAFPEQYSDVSYGLAADLTTLGYFTRPTPGWPNVGEPVDDPRQIVINEIMYHPFVGDPTADPPPIVPTEVPAYNDPPDKNDRWDYIELLNRGVDPISLLDWQFIDGVDYTFPDVTLQPDEYLVVAADVQKFAETYPAVTNVIGGWDGKLSNSGEAVELIDDLGRSIDRVQYADEGDWATREQGPLDNNHRGWIWSDATDGGGKSLELINPAMSNNNGQNWAASAPDGGTPGVVNSVADDDIAPMILDVAHYPLIPRSNDPVTVTARLKNELATGVTATVYYRVDGSPGFSTMAMYDNGLSGDGEALDGVYGAVLPPRADGTVVEFYVHAADAGGHERTWPAPTQPSGLQLTNLLYQVDDTFDPDAQWVPGSQPIYYLIMTEAERAELDLIGSQTPDANSDAQMNATFIGATGTDTEVRYNMGIRNRGAGTRTTRPNNYRVNFPQDRPWKNVTAVNVNAYYTPLQFVGSTILRMAGLPAEDAVAVKVRVNGEDLALDTQRMYGSYVSLQVYDGDFANKQFPDDSDGNVYKASTGAHSADLSYRGTDPQTYINRGYSKSTNSSENDWTDLINLTWWLNNGPDATYAEDVAKVIDVDQWLRWFAAQALIGNNETNLSTGIGDDYSMYRGGEDPRFLLLSHDLDSIFTHGAATNASIFRATGLAAIDRFLRHPAFVGRYYAVLKELIETTFSPAQINPMMDHALAGYVPQSYIDGLKQWVADRNAYVLSVIPQDFSVHSSLPVVGGYHLTGSPAAAITGTADASVTQLVRVNGTDAEWSPQDGTWAAGEGGSDATVLSFQNGVSPDGAYAGTLDTEIRYSAPDADLSSADSINVDGADAGGAVQALMRFDNVFGDGPGQVALTDPIARATLTLNVTDTGNNMQLHRMLSTWAETSNWNTFGGNGIQANGVEAMAAVDATASAGSTGRTTIDVTNAVLAWQADPSSNHGWVLLPTGSGGVDFDSSEGLSGSSRPELSITLDDGTPGAGGVPLNPGVNRIVVETFGNPEGTGEPLETGYIDIWCDPTQTEVVIPGGNVSGEWSPASGYYHVTGSITVPAGQTLSIQPGTAVYFDPNTSMTVNGRLLAEGLEDRRITLTRYGTSGAWAGIGFDYGSYSNQVNRIAYTDIQYSDAVGDAIDLRNGQLVLEGVHFIDHDRTYYLDIHSSSIIVRDCTFPDLSSGELIHSTGFPVDGYALFEGNWFGRANGYNDVIDFTGGQRPGPILRVMNNYFSGGGDDALDLDSTDAHIEGNVFVNFHQDGSRDSKSHAIATGNDLDQETEVTIVRNLFYDVDHAVIIKDGAFGTIVNNTIVNVYKKYTNTNATTAAINFFEDRPPQYEGNGVYLDGNIFYNVSALFEHLEPTTRPVAVTMNNSIVYPATTGEPVSWVGTGNLIDVDPLLTDPSPVDITEAGLRAAFQLLPGSPALGAGPNGVDIGGLIAAGATIAGEPPANTTETSATLTVGGPQIYGYKYRVNAGAWSGERAVAKTVQSITRSGSTATVTITGHGYANGNVVDIYGPKQQEYNGTFTIANVTTNTFQITVTGAPASPAIGTIIARRQEPIVLTGLTPGDYTVEVIARDSAGVWQAEADATVSRTWTVDVPGGAPPSAPANQAEQMTPLAEAPIGSVVASGIIPPGNITVDTTFTAEDGPYTLTGNVVVDPGVTLTIEPGTTLFFQNNTSLTINGRLLAEGTMYEQIRFTHVPGGGSWNGVQFADTMADNRITYAVLEYATTDLGLVGVVNSNLLIDHCTFDHAQRRRIRTLDSSLIVRNSTFIDIFGPGEAPLTDNFSEHIWGRASDSGPFIIENNVFGTSKGHNDLVDVDGHSSPATVMQYLNNVFLGSGDDALDLEGDALIEGNTFTHIRKDQWNTGTGDSNVISAGAGHNFTMVRNTFYDVDHIAQVKDDAFMTLVNNTLVGAAISAVYFVRPGDTSDPGRGAYVEGNIFADTPVIFDEVQVDTDLVANRNIMPAAYHMYGVGNLDEDPRLADPAGSDFSLLPGSPGLGTGPNGLSIGAMVPGGPSISGEPPALTVQTGATLTIGGPGVTDYKYRVNGGTWSSETPFATPIVLSGLANGDYTVEVLGKNSANVWQDEADAAVSKTWTVDSSLAQIRINEVLALNTAVYELEEPFSDLIELYNDGPAAVNLAGMSISDDANDPAKFVFPDGVPAETTIPAGGYLVLYADEESNQPGLHLGFALSGDGEGVFLYGAYDPVPQARPLLDSVQFGVQIPNLSIGRVGHEGDWVLTEPTFGEANVAARTGDPSTLQINEWLAAEEVLFDDDFVELYNPDSLPVGLGGLFLTDDPYARPGKHEIAPLSFIAGGGYAAFVADSDLQKGPNHVDFKLSAETEMLGLYDAELGEIDKIIYYPQTTDASEGRAPDGAETYDFFMLPTPGVSNPSPDTVTVGLIAIDDVWSYDQSGSAPAPNWNQPGFNPIPAWPAGAAPLGVENDPIPVPINTPLTLGSPQVMVYYFRTHFTLDADPASVVLEMTTLVDDGAVFYLNGEPVYRLGMDPDVRTVGDANFEGPFSIPTDHLVQGDNVLAVEVHQTSSTSSDVVFALRLDAQITVSEDERIAEAMALIGGLRITEMMYHPTDDADTEFIELQNVSGTTLNLDGVRLAGGIDFTFPSLLLLPNQYVVVVRDLEAFEREYGPGINVAGQYSGNLSNGGEDVTLKLAAPLEAAMLRFTYDDAWYPTTDGGGYALEIRDPTAKPASWGDPANWQAGTIEGGTPGSADGQPLRDVLLNEVLSHTDYPPDLDAIELYNTTGQPIDVGGWFLSDSGKNLRKFEIPAGTIIPAGGYVVFDEADFNPTWNDPEPNPGPNDFALNGAHGDDVWLVETDAEGNPIRVADHVEFGAAAGGESFGRWPNGAGALYPMTTSTLDKAHPENGQNSGPRVGPVLISEVQYNPSPLENDDYLEFVEIYNSTAATIDLTNWRIRGGADFDFPPGTTLDGYSTLLVVPFELSNTARLNAFLSYYQIDYPVEIVGGYSGALSDDGGRVQLQRADAPPLEEPNFIPHLLEDEVIYDNRAPWPTDPDGGGDSLNRTEIDAWGNTPSSWYPDAPTPGVPIPPTWSEVVGRYIFYNGSQFDGRNLAANAQDDAAVAFDKEALLPGGAASFVNYTSFSSGINGVMIDIVGLQDGVVLEADDFQFRVGNNNNPGSWAAAPALPTITLRPGEGQGGSDRVTLIWGNNVIQKQWLEVTVLATEDTRLEEADVFYFGNAIGDSGNSATDAKVNATDMLAARNNPRTFINPAPIDFRYDYDRDARVNATDMLIARNNQTSFLTDLKLISVPANKAAAEAVAAVEEGSAYDAVLQQAGGRQLGGGETSADRLSWLYEFELKSTLHRSSEQAQPAVRAIDTLLATDGL